MKTAQLSQSSWGSPSGGGSSSRKPAATEEAVDLYSQRVLEELSKTCEQPAPDESLGSYVASLLRLSRTTDVTSIPDFESLIELLQDHCNSSREGALDALQRIAEAVVTGCIPTPEASAALPSMKDLERVLPELSRLPPPAQDQSTQQLDGGAQVITPRMDLIPVDLLEEEDPPQQQSQHDAESAFPPLGQTPLHGKAAASSNEFPPLGSPPTTSKKAPRGKKSSKQQTVAAAEDLAASLFRSSRSRQSSIDETVSTPSPNLQPTTTPASMNEEYQYVAEVLLSMNMELSEEAALQAARMASNDVNLAQYLVERATTAPPVCRHLLNSGCYRSDCSYSHDIEGHTCIFWLRGRCGKGESCLFLHGYDEKILAEVLGSYQQQSVVDYGGAGTIDPAEVYYSHTAAAAAAAAAPAPPPGYPSLDAQGASYSPPAVSSMPSSSSSSWGPGSREARIPTGSLPPPQQQQPISFANVASQGYRTGSFSFGSSSGANRGGSDASETFTPAVVPTVKIPQDLWNPHENRDASLFYIADPLERYHQVNKTVTTRRYGGDFGIMDLHFQSQKTFPTVLETILPDMLAQYASVWIVTGTGHHVGKKTHQKGGGALESAVLQWLLEQGYHHVSRGKDRNGQGGALFVQR